MREDETVSADAGVVADHDRFGGIDVRQLQNDGAAAEHEFRFGQLRAADVDLLADLRVLTDLDDVARQITERSDARVAADANRLALDDGHEPDLHVIGELDLLADDDAAETDSHSSPDAISEKQAVGQNFQRARQPAEQYEVPPGDARFGKECFGHWGRNVRFDAL